MLASLDRVSGLWRGSQAGIAACRSRDASSWRVVLAHWKFRPHISRPSHFEIDFGRRSVMEIANCNRIAGDRACDQGASILEHGDDAAHCSNGLNAQKFRDATPNERVIYRRWIRRALMLYGLLALAAGTAVWINGAAVGPTQLTSLSSASATKSGHSH
jgi:hypothetical protein